MAIPGELVCPFNESGLSCSESGNAGLKENPEYHQVAHLLVRPGAPLLRPGQATSLTSQGTGMVGLSLGPPEMSQKPVIKKPNTTLKELENSGLLH